MDGSRLRVAYLAALALVAGCASAPADEHALKMARQAYVAGEFDTALHYSTLAMQRAPSDARSLEIGLHLNILRAARRDEEARALEDFVARFEAGEDTESEDVPPTRTECANLERSRRKSMRLVRKYGDAYAERPFEFGYATTTYQIDASGRPVNIRVVRARHPAAAWIAIQSVAALEVWTSRLEKLDASVFPIDYCVNVKDAPPVVPRTL